jgi:hypothetical protein
MIHEGERNREEKVKLIVELLENTIEMDIIQAKRNIILFLCSECGLQISFEPNVVFSNSPRIDFNYEDFRVWFQNDPDFVPIENNYKNTKISSWGGPTSQICLDCGKGLFEDEVFNTNCGHKNVVAGSELGGQPCPVCGTKLNKGIEIKGLKAFFAKCSELKDEWWNIYRERYKVKKPLPYNYSQNEIIEQERRKSLIKCYDCDFYVIDRPNNIIRFEFRDSFFSGNFQCILEWDNESEGKLTLYRHYGDLWIEKNIEYEKVKQIILILEKYNYFDVSSYKKTFGLDGYTFALEIKYKKEYKELAIWGIEKGVLYDVGMTLIQFAGKTFKDLYKYAW